MDGAVPLLQKVPLPGAYLGSIKGGPLHDPPCSPFPSTSLPSPSIRSKHPLIQLSGLGRPIIVGLFCT